MLEYINVACSKFSYYTFQKTNNIWQVLPDTFNVSWYIKQYIEYTVVHFTLESLDIEMYIIV